MADYINDMDMYAEHNLVLAIPIIKKIIITKMNTLMTICLDFIFFCLPIKNKIE